jgi:oligoribonuclease NrnB/cAMP/cGMP phosphodiesterase (DHH superfamily)
MDIEQYQEILEIEKKIFKEYETAVNGHFNSYKELVAVAREKRLWDLHHDLMELFNELFGLQSGIVSNNTDKLRVLCRTYGVGK